MSGTRAKRQHYVPRFYLDYFKDEGGYVYTYDKRDGSCRAAKPQDTATESNFYSFDGPDGEHLDQLETTLAEIESLAAPIHAQLVAGKLPIGEERERYSLFLATLYTRSPAMVNAMAGLFGDIAQIAATVGGKEVDVDDFLAQYETDHGKLGDLERAEIRALIGNKNSIVMNVDRRIGLNAMNSAPSIAGLFTRMSWIIVETDGQGFITSDNPVVRASPPVSRYSPYGDGGFLHKRMYVSVPLSPNRLLELAWGPGDVHGVRYADRERRKLYNRARAVYSERYLFANSRDSGIASLAAKYPEPGIRIDAGHPSKRYPIKVKRRLEPRGGAT